MGNAAGQNTVIFWQIGNPGDDKWLPSLMRL
jgi:hypothetical protein